MRVIECDICGETISAADDEELAGRLKDHLDVRARRDRRTTTRSSRRSTARPTTRWTPSVGTVSRRVAVRLPAFALTVTVFACAEAGAQDVEAHPVAALAVELTFLRREALRARLEGERHRPRQVRAGVKRPVKATRTRGTASRWWWARRRCRRLGVAGSAAPSRSRSGLDGRMRDALFTSGALLTSVLVDACPSRWPWRCEVRAGGVDRAAA